MKQPNRLNPKKNRSARRPRPIDHERKDLRRMTYATTFWKTAEGKRRSETKLVARRDPNEEVVFPLPSVEVNHANQPN